MNGLEQFFDNVSGGLGLAFVFSVYFLLLFWVITIIILPILVYLMHRRLRRMEQASRDMLSSLLRIEGELSRRQTARTDGAMPTMRAER